jgi:hypothetical protein
MFRHVSSDRRTFGLRKTFDETKRRPPRLSSVEPFGFGSTDGRLGRRPLSLMFRRRRARRRFARARKPRSLHRQLAADVHTGHPGEARAPASVGRRTDQGKSGDIRLDLRCGRQIHHRARRRTVHRIDLMLIGLRPSSLPVLGAAEAAAPANLPSQWR